MLKCPRFSITFEEIPEETSLMLMISGCKNNCPGCHSNYLKLDIGEPLETLLPILLKDYKYDVSTVLFMGGEHNLPELIELTKICK